MMVKRNRNIKLNYKFILLTIIFIFSLISSIYISYSLILLSGIETPIRIIVIIILLILLLCLNLKYLSSYFNHKKRYYFYTIFLIIYSIILIFIGNIIIKTYSKIDNLTTNKTLYSSSLVSLVYDDISDIKGKIGILKDEESIDGNQIPNEIIEDKKLKNEIVKYDSYISLLNALNKEVDAIFLPTSYNLMFQNIEGININLSNLNKIYSKEKFVKKENNNGKTLEEPFTVLLMGVDSEVENISNSTFNGDSLMLLTFNPKTLSTTILSIPRDTYVPIACFEGKRRNKITHAAWYGESCMINTIEDFTDVEIDYYVKINFTGIVKLVDNLGGIELDIPYSFCEQNSKREWGENTIYVEEGHQLLNGEQALAYARNRHPNPTYCSSKWTNYVSNDFIRGQHQQEVLKAILNKLKNISNLDTVYNLLDTISNSMETNMTTNEILSLYNIGKDILAKNTGNVEDLISMKKLYLSGVDAYIYDTYTGLTLYNYVLYNESLEEVINAMQINLELEKQTNIKEFSFNYNEEYEEKVIGKGDYNELPSYKTLPNFLGDSEYQARKTAKELGIKVSFKYDSNVSGITGTVVKQNYKAGTLVDNISSLVLTIKKEQEKSNEENLEDENSSENEEDENVDIEDILPTE